MAGCYGNCTSAEEQVARPWRASWSASCGSAGRTPGIPTGFPTDLLTDLPTEFLLDSVASRWAPCELVLDHRVPGLFCPTDVKVATCIDSSLRATLRCL